MVFRLVSFWSSYQVDKEVSWMSLWVNPRTPFLHFLLVIWLKVHYCSVIISMGWCDSNDHYAYIGSDLLSLISLFSNGLMPWCCVEAPMVQSESACRVATSRCGRQLPDVSSLSPSQIDVKIWYLLESFWVQYWIVRLGGHTYWHDRTDN